MSARHIRQLLALAFAVERGGDSGTIDLRTSAERALLYFRGGKLVFVEQSSLGKTLGAYLVDQGLLTRLQYQTVVASLAKSTEASPLLAFMERVTRDQMIDPSMASAILAAQVERNFIRCFGWEHEYAQFSPEATVLEGQPVFPCSLAVLTVQGVRTHLSAADTSAVLEPYVGRRPSFAKSVDLLSREFRLQPRDERYLRQLDDRGPLEGLETLPPELQTLLAALFYSGRLSFVSDATSSSGQHPSLGDGRAAPAVGRLRFTLPTPPSAEEVEAAAAHQRGRGRLEHDPASACAELRRAARLVSRPDYQLYAAWAEYLIADEATRDTLRSELEDAARRALESDSTLSFGYFVVGQLHLAYGDRENALLAFERSAALDPSNVHTKLSLEELRDRSGKA